MKGVEAQIYIFIQLLIVASIVVGLNGKGTTGNSTPCSRTLVYRKKTSDNIPPSAVEGIFLLSQPSFNFIWPLQGSL